MSATHQTFMLWLFSSFRSQIYKVLSEAVLMMHKQSVIVLLLLIIIVVFLQHVQLKKNSNYVLNCWKRKYIYLIREYFFFFFLSQKVCLNIWTWGLSENFPTANKQLVLTWTQVFSHGCLLCTDAFFPLSHAWPGTVFSSTSDLLEACSLKDRAEMRQGNLNDV